MNILTIICARGGSKSVSHKNLKSILGKPLIYYTISQAIKFKKINPDITNTIIVSTDNLEIASFAFRYGVLVPFLRPNHLATDNCGKIDVLRHALIKMETITKQTYDIVIDLDVTAPIRTINDIRECLDLFIKKKPDVVFSVVNSRKNPYFNMVKIKDGFASLCDIPPKLILRRQDAPKVYDMNTSIYVYGRQFLLNPENISVHSSAEMCAFVMDDISGIDIDSELDFKYIEFLVRSKMVKL